MMVAALGHQLETLGDGATCFIEGEGRPMPLMGTQIDVQVTRGLATLTTVRTFQNAEQAPIEVVLTMPVGFDAVVTGLSARIGERTYHARARAKAAAREKYEAAIDEGRIAVLHEEALRGIHILSVGSLPAGAEVSVTIQTVAPLTNLDGVPFLRIPTTVGQLYGTSPLLPADDLATSERVRHEATLTIAADEGVVRLVSDTDLTPENLKITLDRAIEFTVEGGRFGRHRGVTADGRAVGITLAPLERSTSPLDLAILVDRSGSTGSAISKDGPTVWSAMRTALERELAGLPDADRIDLWQFDTTCQNLGSARGAKAAPLARALGAPHGGTELGQAVSDVLASGARHILVLTDGMTHAALVERLKASEARISAILVGPASLDAHVGQICAITGGQVFYARGDDVSPALRTALGAMRRAGGHVTGQVVNERIDSLAAIRGGVEITAIWEGTSDSGSTDEVGRLAAALALPLLPEQNAPKWAEANGLCTYLTSLVLVDEQVTGGNALPEMRKVPLMQSQEYLGYTEAPIAVSFSRRSVGFGHAASIDSRVSSPNTIRRTFPPRDQEVARLALSLDWARLGPSLATGDLSSLSRRERALIERVAGMPSATELASRKAIPPVLIAICLLALLARDDRYARRVARELDPDSSCAQLSEKIWTEEGLGSPI